MVKDGANLLASQMKIKKKTQFRTTQTRVDLGIALLLFVSVQIMMPGLNLLLCLLLKMMPGGSQKTQAKTVLLEVGILLLWAKDKMKHGANQKIQVPSLKKQIMELGTGTKLDHQTKLMAVIGVNQSFLAVLIHQAGTRGRQLRGIIRIAPGADLLETLKVAVGSGEDAGEAGAENLGILVTEMTKEAARAHGVMTVLQSPLGGLIHR